MGPNFSHRIPVSTEFSPDSILTLPVLAALPRALMAALRTTAETAGSLAALAEPRAVLADTLDALVLLGADSESLAAALLDAIPAWADAIAG